MRRFGRLFLVVALGSVVAGALVLGGWWDRSYDPGFDTSVPAPIYTGGGPVVLYDEAHHNTHTSSAGYRPLAEMIRSDGYSLRVGHEPLSAAVLDDVAILLLVLPRGSNDANDDPAYTEAEASAVHDWVRAGGSLLLVTDHWPYGAAARSLAERFGVQVAAGMVLDPIHHDAERGDSHLVFSTDNGLLREHAIVRGRSDHERVRRVLTFTGNSLTGPPGSVAFLQLSDAAQDLPPGEPEVVRDGGDVRVTMEYGDPVSAAGRAQGIAIEDGNGRVVVLGEAGMLRAQRDGDLGVGMNVEGYDNRQLALNILHWLSRDLPEDPWERADAATTRLDPEGVPGLPEAVVEALRSRGCTIPQVADRPDPHNAVRGEFLAAGEEAWAVLCSIDRMSGILVLDREGAVVADLGRRPDRDFLQGLGGDRIGHSRLVTAASPARILQRFSDHDFGADDEPDVTHDGIDDAFEGKASRVHYFVGGRWIVLPGAD